MALLADARRKQKLSVDPRGVNWSQDDSKFGQKMLEKFGWSNGKGLGANEDGRVEHVKLAFKNDSRGVGFTKKDDSNWIAHQDDFNDLLASLNASHSTQDSSGSSSKVQSLEERSKSSKGRLHYQKFTRGKDLSAKKDEDLNCIFGRKSKSAPATPQDVSRENSQPNSDTEDGDTKDKAAVDTELSEHGVKTISSTLSVQDYFKQKMDLLKSKRNNQSAPSLVSLAGQSEESPVPEKSGDRSSGNESEGQDKKKKKKSKKSKKIQHTEDNPEAKESRKRKRKEEKEEVKEKRKRKEKVTFSIGESDEDLASAEGPEDEETVDAEEHTEKPKKKKKKSSSKDKETAAEANQEYDISVGKKSKKDKKKKLKTEEECDTMEGEDNTVDQACEEVKKAKKKKSKDKDRDNAAKVESSKSECDSSTKRTNKKAKNAETHEEMDRNKQSVFPGANWTKIQGYGCIS